MLLEDESIIKAITHGENTGVLKLLYKSTLPKIRAYIQKNNGSRAEAEDIFQDAVVILFSQVKQKKFDQQYSVEAFLYTVAKNLWINRVKKRNKSVVLDDDMKHLPETKSFLEDMISDEKIAAVREALEQLGNPCAELLKYQMYEKLSVKEIAKKMGLTNENVTRVYNHRCKQKLLQLIENSPALMRLLRP